jgi:oligosaccharide reducing-end xylanase
MPNVRRLLLASLAAAFLLTACGGQSLSSPTPAATQTPLPLTPTPLAPTPTQTTIEGGYHNLFSELLSKSDTDIESKLEAAWQQFFYGDDDTERVYYPVGEDMAYIEDIGNGDVRSEGMSYGMMIAVQMDKQEEFNRLWKWAKTYMYQADGPYEGYFAWHCTTDGDHLDSNPASDGEEWFVMDLFFAAHRWGNGEGIYDYEAEANAILHTMLHKEDDNSPLATNMFDEKTHQVVFVPSVGAASSYTDPSYHLPHYYELWAEWAAEDNSFWQEAAASSRAFLKTTVNPDTGLMPDYANFDGTPRDTEDDYHAVFRFDAWRTTMNIAVDYAWSQPDQWEVEQSDRILDFFYGEGIGSYANQYTLDGKALSGDHSPGLVSMNAVGALAATNDHRSEFVAALWNLQPPSGKWRYYDGMLYMLGLLHVSGQFKIYEPTTP